MSAVIASLLPVGMMVLMLALGLRLAPAELAQTLRRPRALKTGLAVQLVGLPLAALAIAGLTGLDAAALTGLVLVAASPGGVTSNYAALLARGSVALSVSMTLVTSLGAPLTLPVVLALAGIEAPGAGGLWRISLGMTAVGLVPLVAGLWVARIAPGFAAAALRGLDPVSRLVFLAIVLATFVQNWAVMRASFAEVGLAVCLYAGLAPILGVVAARARRLTRVETRTIMIEASMQNVAITIFVATALMAIPALAIPGLIYAVLMNVVALGIIVAARLGRTG